MTISVCIGSACHLKGSYAVINAFQKLIKESGTDDEIELKAVFCLGHCMHGVAVQLGEDEEPDEDKIFKVGADTAETFFNETVLPMLKADPSASIGVH